MKRTEKKRTSVKINKTAGGKRKSDGRRWRQREAVIIAHYIQFGSVEHICTGTGGPLKAQTSFYGLSACFHVNTERKLSKAISHLNLFLE